jgi:hypothetical protein
MMERFKTMQPYLTIKLALGQSNTWELMFCDRKTCVAQMSFVGENIRKWIEDWMGAAMPLGGRVTKNNACMANSVVYQMSLRLLHETNIEGIQETIEGFLWSGNKDKKRYHLVCSKLICKPRAKGGLGLKNVTKFNIILMC